MSRFNEFFVPSYKRDEKTVTIPAGYYTYGMQEGNDIANQSTPSWHSESEQGNRFEYYSEESVYYLEEVYLIEENDNGIRIVIDTWVQIN